jgi:hypothetical protein
MTMMGLLLILVAALVASGNAACEWTECVSFGIIEPCKTLRADAVASGANVNCWVALIFATYHCCWPDEPVGPVVVPFTGTWVGRWELLASISSVKGSDSSFTSATTTGVCDMQGKSVDSTVAVSVSASVSASSDFGFASFEASLTTEASLSTTTTVSGSSEVCVEDTLQASCSAYKTGNLKLYQWKVANAEKGIEVRTSHFVCRHLTGQPNCPALRCSDFDCDVCLDNTYANQTVARQYEVGYFSVETEPTEPPEEKWDVGLAIGLSVGAVVMGVCAVVLVKKLTKNEKEAKTDLECTAPK